MRKTIWKGRKFRVITEFSPVYGAIVARIEERFFLFTWSPLNGPEAFGGCDLPRTVERAKQWDATYFGEKP